MNQSPPHILLEVCVGSLADIEAAVAAGAGRLELCSALELGGLTPSIGLVEAALSASPIPIIVMVRPRAGGFCYDRHEFEVMLRDAGRFLEMGASGIAFGILDKHGRIDRARSLELINLANSLDAVFHRAFDFVSEEVAALDELVELECTRVLTSGGKPAAAEGTSIIRQLIDHAAGHIEVLPGGGINSENVVEIVRETGCCQVHLGAAIARDDGSIADASIPLCDRRFMQGTSHRVVNADALAATVAALQNATGRPGSPNASK
jgi:copper homeostasis protein